MVWDTRVTGVNMLLHGYHSGHKRSQSMEVLDTVTCAGFSATRLDGSRLHKNSKHEFSKYYFMVTLVDTSITSMKALRYPCVTSEKYTAFRPEITQGISACWYWIPVVTSASTLPLKLVTLRKHKNKAQTVDTETGANMLH